VKDEHAKDAAQDAAQDVAHDVTQDLAQDVLNAVQGAHRGTRYLQAADLRPNTHVPPPALALGWHLKDMHAKDAAQGVA